MLELPAADGEPRLRAASDLLTVPDEPGGERRKQARALWQTLNMTLEEIELQGARVQQLTAQSERLQRELSQARAEAATWKQRAERAERSAEREPWLLAALGALGLVGAAFAGLWWRRREEASRALWWMPEEPTTSDSTREQEARSTGIAPGVETEREEAGQNGAQERRNAEKPAPAAAVLAEAQGKVQPIPPTPAGHAPDGPLAQARELAPSVADASELVRAVKVDELLDVEEEAEFFISLGQYDQAIAALHRHMAENPAASALVYLDLLGLYHRTGRKDAYEALRAKFNATFNAEAPAFDDYVEGGNGLEAYPRTLSRIQSLWPSPKVIGVIGLASSKSLCSGRTPTTRDASISRPTKTCCFFTPLRRNWPRVAGPSRHLRRIERRWWSLRRTSSRLAFSLWLQSRRSTLCPARQGMYRSFRHRRTSASTSILRPWISIHRHWRLRRLRSQERSQSRIQRWTRRRRKPTLRWTLSCS